MRIRTILAAAAAPAALAAVLLGTAGQASAATTGPAENISFFSGGSGNAHWLPQQAGVIITAGPDAGSYGGFEVHHFNTSLPTHAPSFTFTEAGTPCPSAPRLVFVMSNGDKIQVNNYTPTADGQTVNQAATYDIYAGPHSGWNLSWDTILQDEQGQKVTAESLVSDTYLNAPNTVIVTGLNDGTATLVG
jgi:hypothetical protein